MSRYWRRWRIHDLSRLLQHDQGISLGTCPNIPTGLSIIQETRHSSNLTSKYHPTVRTLVVNRCFSSTDHTIEDARVRLDCGEQDCNKSSPRANIRHVDTFDQSNSKAMSYPTSNSNISYPIGSEKSGITSNQIVDFEGTDHTDVIEGTDDEKAIADIPVKTVVKPVHNFAALVTKSETLSKLVLVGVDLSIVERNRDAADFIVRLNFEADVKPYLFFLHDIGIANESLGPVLTRNPMILREDLENLRLRVDYFRSKNFPHDAISRIVTKAPNILSFDILDIDKRLGVYQQEFKLSGMEVREVITRLPKLLTWNIPKVKEVKFYMEEYLGFSQSEIKEILLKQPKVLLSDKHQLGKQFDYLYNVMKISHTTLVLWPDVFRTRLHTIRDRHQFLQHLGRDQFDPTKENYVSLQKLVTGRDRDFCFHVAKNSVSQFNEFLKSL